MRVLIQRVTEARVEVAGTVVAAIGPGLLVFVGIKEEDNEKTADYLSEKVVHLRIFDDEDGKLNLSALQINAEILVVSQFTLYGDCKKGRRPSYSAAMAPDKAKELYEIFVTYLEAFGLSVKSGVFQEKMQVSLVNDGPVTLLIEN